MIARGGPRPAPGTLTDLFFRSAERFDRRDAYLVKIEDSYRPVSHRQLLDRVRHAAKGLARLGLSGGDRVGIMSETRFEWAIADYACLTARMTDVPVYPTLTAEQAAYILADSGAAALFVSTASQARKMSAVRSRLPKLRTIISFEPAPDHADLTLGELEASGGGEETAEGVSRYRDLALQATPDDVATIIYTSGTTGEPKGVVLTHDNLHSNVIAALRMLPVGPDDRSLSLLPLAHIFARMADHYTLYAAGATIAYAESFESVARNLAEVRPTIVLSVPRMYEKIHARAVENAISGGRIKAKIFGWAAAVGQRWAEAVEAAGRAGPLLRAQHTIADKLVYSKLRARTGGQLRYFVSGAAPLSPEINKFFYAAGLRILEGYGLTETSPLISVNTPENFRIGTVGKPADGVEVRIADDGEILTRGPHVMRGYYRNPEATRAAIDDDGWFHTGDVGRLEDGFLRITDRKKDLIVTAGGKNIAPQPIEGRLISSKFVNQAVMIGDRRKYPVMLIVPDFDQLERWAAAEGLSWSGHAELIQLPAVRAMMDLEMKRTLTGLAPFEMPKKLALLENEFSIERGEMTPTHKIRRRVIDERYRAVIDGLYAADPAGH